MIKYVSTSPEKRAKTCIVDPKFWPLGKATRQSFGDHRGFCLIIGTAGRWCTVSQDRRGLVHPGIWDKVVFGVLESAGCFPGELLWSCLICLICFAPVSLHEDVGKLFHWLLGWRPVTGEGNEGDGVHKELLKHCTEAVVLRSRSRDADFMCKILWIPYCNSCMSDDVGIALWERERERSSWSKAAFCWNRYGMQIIVNLAFLGEVGLRLESQNWATEFPLFAGQKWNLLKV